ncbi:hypothetical protein DERP_005949 [Dermatophagoides pteronyssinus]|uniref:Uncharacterized protein n=1 Tax=Dermatophagoides pteronyssinus TaxID=6956 RepID=A0ABQ8JRW2_DERPT|nr:hypothetical protein DERP_005949 [Dermatophagoides pteronyssinus]
MKNEQPTASTTISTVIDPVAVNIENINSVCFFMTIWDYLL